MDTICFYFMQYRTLSPSRDVALQEVLKPQGLSRGNESLSFFNCFSNALDSSFSNALDSSFCLENHRDFPDESSDCHVVSDELVFEVKFVSKVCQ